MYRARLRGLSLAWIPCLATALAAQQFEELRRRPLPGTVDRVRTAVALDVDYDGDRDLLLADGRLQLVINRGRGTFDESALRVAPDFVTALEVLDLDRDGVDESVLVCSDGGTDVYTFDRQGGVRLGLGPETPYVWSVAAGDLDGDGMLDLVLGGTSPLVWKGTYVPNPIPGVFIPYGWMDVTTTSLPPQTMLDGPVELGDLDGDGDLDLVAGLRPSSQSQPRLAVLFNDGSGAFTPTASGLPNGLPVTALCLVDADADGDLDIAYGDEILLNDGAGVFTSGPVLATGFSGGPMTCGDVDGDGVVEFVVLDQSGLTIFARDGQGGYQPRPAAPGQTASIAPLLLEDLDGDGLVDVVGQASLQPWLLGNNGRGAFDAWSQEGLPRPGEAFVVVGDLDADGDVDAVARGGVLVNEGQGYYREGAPLPPIARNHGQPAVADIDGDGDLDAIFSDNGTLVHLDNDGSGQLSALTWGGISYSTLLDKLLEDLDGDGDPDLIFGDQIWFNDGTGFWWPRRTGFIQGAPLTGALLVDVDGNQAPDLLDRRTGRLWLNDGSGAFTEVTATHAPSLPFGQANVYIPGDADGDGDVDLFLGTAYIADELWLNDGTGRFARPAVPLLPGTLGSSWDAAFGDVDLDGDQDLIVRTDNDRVRLLRNDGTGSFSEAVFAAGHASAPVWGASTVLDSLVITDVDQDGDPDVLAVNSENTAVFVNRHRQISAPHVPRIGQSYVLDVSARPGYGGSGVPVFPLLSGGALPVRVPVGVLGSLGLDPQLLVPLPPVMLTGAGGGQLSLPIPDDSQLVGASFFVQAITGAPDFHLTGMLAETVLR